MGHLGTGNNVELDVDFRGSVPLNVFCHFWQKTLTGSATTLLAHSWERWIQFVWTCFSTYMPNVEIIVVEDEDEVLNTGLDERRRSWLSSTQYPLSFLTKDFLKEKQLAPRAARCCEG